MVPQASESLGGNSTSVTYVSNCLVIILFFVFVFISLFINLIFIIVSFLAKLADVVCDKVGTSYCPTLVSHCLRHAVLVSTHYVEKNALIVTRYALQLNKWNPRKL